MGEPEEFEMAEKAIYKALESAEQKIEEAVANEVQTLFPRDENKRHEVKIKAKKAIQKGAAKTKRQAQEKKTVQAEVLFPYDRNHPYPYDIEGVLNKEKREHRILHAIESAEKAILHAIQDEVDVLFHEDEHSHDQHQHRHDKDEEDSTKSKTVASVKKSSAHDAVSKGVEKAQQSFKKTAEERRKGDFSSFIDEYCGLE
jgi:hypothetical protein